MTRLKHSPKILLLTASMAAAACGGSTSVSPTAPTGVGTSSASAAFGGTSAGINSTIGAVITGRVTGGTTTSAQLARSTDGAAAFGGGQLASTTDPNVVTVSVVGTSTSTTVGPGGEFTLTGVPSGSVQLQFTSRSGSATLTISGVEPTDRIEIAVALSGSIAKVESENRRREDTSRVEVNGRVTIIGAGTLTVGTTLVTVSATAIIRHGSQTLTLVDIKIGDHVEVKGTRNTTGVTATEIKVESDSEDEDDDSLVGGAAAGSPTSGTSKPSSGSASGGSATGGKDDNQDDESEDEGGSDELKGSVTSLGATACPNLSFAIKGVTVTTSMGTKFDGVSCGAIKVGTSLEVKGTKTGSALAATKVERN